MKNKFQKLIYSAFMAIIIFASCSTEETDLVSDASTALKRGMFNSPVTVINKEVVFYKVNKEGAGFIKVIVEEIDENRCPADVWCFWSGYARVSFTVSGIESPVDLFIQFDPEKVPNRTPDARFPESYTFSLEGRNYVLILQNVTPYPTTTNSDLEKSVQFVLNQY